MPLTNLIPVTVALFFFQLAFASSFYKTIHGVQEAHDELFHDSLKKQLDTSRGKNAPISETFLSTTTNFLTNDNGTSNETFATGSTASFQLYTSDMLTTAPVPSAACLTALTTVIQCNSTVPLMSSYPYLLTNDLATVCTSTCTNSLASYRTNIISACGTYRIPGTGGSTYLPTFAIDIIAGPYSVQCLQDPTSQAFCQPLLNTYNSSTNTNGVLGLPTDELCTFCTLETMNLTLSNPATYFIPLAEVLSSAVQQCGSAFNSYNVSSPPSASNPPIVNPSNMTTGTNKTTSPSSDCAIRGRNITLPNTADTTCSALATQFSVTIDSILSSNPFLTGSSDCVIATGTQVCIPQACTLYTVQVNDTCNSIGTAHSLTPIQVQSFNPSLGSSCQLISSFIGESICISPNGGFPSGFEATSNGNPSATPTVVAPVPSPTVNGTTSACGRWYQVQPGDICNTVALANSVSLPDFLTLNPEVNANCTNLWLGYYYCVAPYPPFNASSATPSLITGTVGSVYAYPIPTANYTSTLNIQIITPAGVPAPTNVAQGTRQVACGYYYTVQSGDTVASIAELTNTTTAGLISWNPELSTGTLSGLVVGTAICVLFPTGNYTLFPAPTPSNLAQAAKVNTSTCAEYYTVQSGDSCAGIEVNFSLTNGQFLALNPGVTAQCTNIVLGQAYCVFSVYASGPVITGPPANVAAGTITTNCTGYYTVVSGDSCGTIETKYNITDPLFHSMNPELTSTCTNLIIGDAYCISTSNTTSPIVGPPSNLASGSLTNCTTYYTVASGESCTTIVGKFTITLSDFFRWNPEVNTRCTNIVLGSAYCVVGGGNPCRKRYTVVSGDSCGTIETTEGVADANLHVLNPWLDANCDIQVGQSLCVG